MQVVVDTLVVQGPNGKKVRIWYTGGEPVGMDGPCYVDRVRGEDILRVEMVSDEIPPDAYAYPEVHQARSETAA